MEPTVYLVWVDPSAKIASFHYEAGYKKMKFYRKERFMAYLVELSEQSFRFQ